MGFLKLLDLFQEEASLVQQFSFDATSFGHL